MTARTSHPLVLALFARPQDHSSVVERLGSTHGFGTIVAENEGEFWSRFAYRKPDVVLLERRHLEQCRSLHGLGCPCVVILDDAPADPSDVLDQFMTAAAAGANGVCYCPVNHVTLSNMINAAMASRGEVAVARR